MSEKLETVMPRKLLTVPEVALILGISRAHLYTAVMRGEIPSIKIGKARRIAVAVLDEWIAQQQEQEQSAQGQP